MGLHLDPLSANSPKVPALALSYQNPLLVKPQGTAARRGLRLYVTEIIYRLHLPWYSRCMKDFGIWFQDLSRKPLPGAVAATAVSAAMGAALIAKATRITLQRQEMDGTMRGALQALWQLADRQQALLVDLAEADECAYRAVLEARSLAEATPAQAAAWLQATEIPVRVAETCYALLEAARPLLNTCWPAVCPDPEIGVWLLETGMRAGLAAAEGNMGFCADAPETHALQRRLDALR